MRNLRYQALGPLLAGEGSRAFLGLEISNERKARPVVLVFVPEEANRDAAFLARVRRETEHAATLDHPNIIRVFAFAAIEERHARVVEFADGESLRRILEVAHVLPSRFAAKIAADAAMGVHYAQVAGNDDGSPLLHGDLRPETLIVSFAGVTKASGYGALNVAPKDSRGLQDRTRRLHSSPEQVVGGREALVPQTDVYLLGLTLYQCLTGQVPFEAAADLDQAILAGLPPPIESPDVPAALKEVVSRAMAKKAPERFPTPLAFKEAIEAAIGKLPSNDELAAYLLGFFPHREETRAARQREIDAGIANFARKQWEAPSVTLPAYAPPAPAPAAAAAASPPKPPPKAAPRPASSRRHEEAEDEPRRREPKLSRSTIAVVASLAVATVAVLWGIAANRVTPEEQGPVPEREVARPPDPPPELVIDARPLDSGVALAEGAVDAGAPEPVVVKAPEEPPSLFLRVEPAVDLVIDGKPAGRSPFRGPIAPGRHVIHLVDKNRGISTSRAVTVRASGVTEHEFTLGKGHVSVSAPEGAVIWIDGDRMGYAPMREVAIWEGGHNIMVTVGKAKWQQHFTVKANERQYFNVETQ